MLRAPPWARPPDGRKRRGLPDPWADLPWEAHPEAQALVAANPDGMTLEEIGAAMGVTRERVRQLEAKALRKLRSAEGDGVIFSSGFALSIPDCMRCGEPFLRMSGRDRHCELCAARRKKRQRAAEARA